jgi:antirestriction protein
MEKLEKLKKSLDNKFIPDNMKDKIRAEIKKLESEIKKDETMTATEVKEEVKEIEEKVEDALEVAEKKEEQAEAKKTTSRKPRAKKTVANKTSSRKQSETSKPKRTAMSLAKEIRKEGESWSEARARASKMMKEDSKEVNKSVESELDKLIKNIRSQKQRQKLSGISNTDIRRDASRKAKPKGRRISKNGKVYYENRDNRTDRLSPTYPKHAPLLADGGYLTDPNFGNFQNQVLANGGSVTNERKHVNKAEDYEVRYAKPRPRRTGYRGVRSFDNGGLITETSNAIFNPNQKNGKIETLFGYKTKEGLLAMMSNVNYYPEEITNAIFVPNAKKGRVITEFGSKTKDGLLEMIKNMRNTFELGGNIVTDLAGHTGGGNAGLNAGMPLDGFSNTGYSGLVGETGAMSSGEMFMAGGSVDKNFNLNGYKLLRIFDNLQKAKDYTDESRVKFPNEKTVVIKDGDDYEVWGTESFRYGKKGNRVYENGGGLPTGAEQPYVITESFGNPAQHFAGGGSLKNERKHVNHNEDYEVRYARKKSSRTGYKGARKFMAGGSMETPKIYVADLEAYNNGRLVGEWLDLTDYNDADELMDAIQDVLKKSGGEEYAIHDIEYIPRSMYSEYMGKRDFEEIYEMMELADRNDLPLEVVMDVVSQYDSSAVDEFYGKYDSADDFAQQLVDDLGIQSFINFERYLIISETDRRLLSQEMADGYVSDIEDEDDGNRIIEEAGLDLDEYENADDDRREEMIEEAKELVYDEYYNNWYDGLSDPYYFLVEEQGLYDAESFANASFVQIDYEDLGDALEDDYAYIYNDGDLYVFNIR